MLRRHWLILIFVVAGATGRILVWSTYRPVLWYNGDSGGFLRNALHLSPDPVRSSGYSFVLAALRPFHSLAAVTALQQVLGVALAVACYWALVHFGVRAWLAALAAAPLLLDGYAIQLQQSLLSDTLFTVVATAALLVLLWPADRPGWAPCLVAALLAGLSVVLRTAGVVIVAVVLVALVLRRPRWRRAVASIVLCAAPIVGYAAWFDSQYGSFSITDEAGSFLYARVVPWAQCAGVKLTPTERLLCDDLPPSARPAQNWYLWNPKSPLYRVPGDAAHRSNVAGSFARKMILHDPLAYAGSVAESVVQTFAWHQNMIQQANPYEFSLRPQQPNHSAERYAEVYQNGKPGYTRVGSTALARRLAQTQRYVRVPGPGYLLALVIAVAGAVAGRRCRFKRFATVTFVAAAVGLLLVAPLTVFYDPRYIQAALPMACLAAGIGAELLIATFRRRPGARINESMPPELQQIASA